MSPLRTFAAGAAIALVLAGCLAQVAEEGDGPGAEASGLPPVPDGSVRFLVIGDYGNGDATQDLLADAMLATCMQRGCQFVITVGDNIYGSGVRSPYDAQFDEKFEEPFADIPLPFYLVLGNHDNGGSNGGNPVVGEYQIAYTTREDRPSDKWNMPARNYAIRYGNVELFGIDSGAEEVSQAPVWWEGTLGTELESWLSDHLGASNATWKFVYAHHPYLSNGLHGNAGYYDNVLGRGLPYKQMLERTVCGQAQVYFAGHDHDLEWLEPGLQCPQTELLLSGAGGGVRAKGAAPDNPARFQAYNTNGFLWVDVTGDTFTGVFVDFENNVLYERSFQRQF